MPLCVYFQSWECSQLPLDGDQSHGLEATLQYQKLTSNGLTWEGTLISLLILLRWYNIIIPLFIASN